MSDLETKLQRPATSSDPRAKAKLKQHLREMSGFRILESDAQGPVRVVVVPAVRPWFWKRYEKDGSDWWFELEK